MKSMYRRIVAVASACVFAIVSIATFFAMRVAMQEEQGTIRSQLRQAAHYAAKVAGQDEELDRISALLGVCVTHMTENGEVLYDTSGQVGYYLDQPDVLAALSGGMGEEISFVGRLAQMQVAVSVRAEDGSILRLTRKQTVFQYGDWGVFAALMGLLLTVSIYLAFSMTRKVVTPIHEISTAAQSIIDGNYNVSTRIESYAELSQLLNTLRSMNTRLRDTVEKLQHKSVELESIINHMINGLIAVDGQLRVVQMNNAAKHMLGVTGNVGGKPVLEATGNSRLEAGLQEAMVHEELVTLELPVLGVSPRHRLIRLYVSPLEHENESIGAVALLEDITEIRNLEQMRTDFAANVTHELKTPLTSIKGFVETLQAGAIEDPEMAKRFLDIIAMEAERLTRLINDVLSLSSMENGRMRVTTERLSLGKHAQDVCLMLENSAKQKNIALSLEAGEDTYITANQDHVKQLLINLIDNAIKYTLNDGKVSVHVYRQEEQVLLRVKDNGIGIAQEHIPRLFERFYRVDKGRSRNMGGTGLGLAIVKHIVMDMGGRIDVQSELNVGTEFIVTLPYAPKQEKD